ncbi:WD40-repeat-containing domain protein [Vararia minispora EC-137]|uniref:WD40-repeat-containing domain protein n=1 Tax=Vararia minispora EC-137 TaxID=1314806 RepID=A0ACB8QJG8_9AGAM|nr:WD40-repeat-containing domain protein [Vararia minispora EC-137]
MRKRRSRVSISNEFSVKRQRISMVPINVEASPSVKRDLEDAGGEPRADRFISTRSDILFPIDTTPRTKRIARAFGLIDDRVLNYTDPPPPNVDNATLSRIRKCASDLFKSTAATHPSSAGSVLARRKQFILALDGPGIPQDPWAYPLAWSRQNLIAVACGPDVYHQNLDTRHIAHLCTLQRVSMGCIRALAFADQDQQGILCLGTSTGLVHTYDVIAGAQVHAWPDKECKSVGALSWRGQEFCVGRVGGDIVWLDSRAADPVRHLSAHRSDIYGLQWSADGKHLLSSDARGTVNLWDARNTCRRIGRVKHDGAVKALAWCPWKTELFATAGTFPDDTIRLWSTSAFASALCPEPVREIETGTNVYSLLWSPHCRELLSTHGLAWGRHPPRAAPQPQDATDRCAPLENSIAVHAYPTGRRVVSVVAHTGVVSQSCLSPDGTSVFTICHREEAMKMWKVWAAPECDPARERQGAFGRFSIR